MEFPGFERLNKAVRGVAGEHANLEVANSRCMECEKAIKNRLRLVGRERVKDIF